MPKRTKPLLLVVDDSIVARERLVRYFEGEGYEIISAGDGADAIKQLKLNPGVSLVLLDLEMPTISGFEVLRMMRAGGIAPKVPVLALTGAYRDSSAISRLKETGATGYINKDVPLEEIRRRVERILFPEKED